jgi:hypothetical protein
MKANTLHIARASITILISLTSNTLISLFLLLSVPIYYDCREDTNDQYNFLDFVLTAIANQHLAERDYLIVN